MKLVFSFLFAILKTGSLLSTLHHEHVDGRKGGWKDRWMEGQVDARTGGCRNTA